MSLKKYILGVPFILLLVYCSTEEKLVTKYTHSKTNIRSSKSTKSKIVKTLEPNQKISVIPSKNDWWKVIRIGNSTESKYTIGYIYKSVLYDKPKPLEKPKEVRSVSMIYDVGSLIGLNIIQIKESIGQPDSDWSPSYEQRRLGVSNTADWYSKEIGISIDYHSNERIKYIFVSNKGINYSANEILKMANLSTNSNQYSLRIQQALNGSGVTGIHINGK